MQGKVKWFDNNKGFGFIVAEDDKIRGDIFVHYSNIEMEGFKALDEDDVVQFRLVSGPKGLSAEDVRLVKVGSDR
jgi:CspA family cold shock protein